MLHAQQGGHTMSQCTTRRSHEYGVAMRACTHNKAVACSHPVLPAPKSIRARARVHTYHVRLWRAVISKGVPYCAVVSANVFNLVSMRRHVSSSSYDMHVSSSSYDMSSTSSLCAALSSVKASPSRSPLCLCLSWFPLCLCLCVCWLSDRRVATVVGDADENVFLLFISALSALLALGALVPFPAVSCSHVGVHIHLWGCAGIDVHASVCVRAGMGGNESRTRRARC